MKWSEEYRQQIKEKVRSVLIRKPRASKYELAKILGISHNVALRLKNQVIEENTSRISEQKVNEEIGKLEAEYEQLALECWQLITQDTRKVKVKILVDKKEKEVEKELLITAGEKLNAIKTIIETRKNLFGIKFDAGVFSRKLGELKLGRTLTKEEQDLIKEAIELDYGKPPKPEPDPNSTAGGNKPEETKTA